MELIVIVSLLLSALFFQGTVAQNAANRDEALMVALLDPEPAFAAYPNVREGRSGGFGSLTSALSGGGSGGSWLSSMLSGFSGVVDRVAQALGGPSIPSSFKQAMQDGPRSPVPAAGFQAPRMTRPGPDVFRRIEARKKQVKGHVRRRRSVPAKAFHKFNGPKGGQIKESNSPLAIEFKQVIMGLAKLFSGMGSLGSIPVSRMGDQGKKFKTKAGQLVDKASDLPNTAFGVMRSKRESNGTSSSSSDATAAGAAIQEKLMAINHIRSLGQLLAAPGKFPSKGRNSGKTEYIPVAVDEHGRPVDIVPYPVDEKGYPMQPVPVDEAGRPVQFVPVDENGIPVEPVFVDEKGKPVRIEPYPADESGKSVEFVPTDEKGRRVQVETVPVDEKGRPVEMVPVDEKGNAVQFVPVDERGNPVEPVPVDERGQPVDVQTMPVDEKGRPVEFVPVDERGQPVKPVPVDEKGRPVQIQPIPVDEHGQPVEMQPIPVDEKGRPVEFVPVDERGQPVKTVPVDEHGRPVAVEPVPVDEKGVPVEAVPVDESGKRVDVQAMPVDGRGRPVSFVPVDESGRMVEMYPAEENGSPVDIQPVPVDRRGRPVQVIPLPVDANGQPVPMDGPPVSPMDAAPPMQMMPVPLDPSSIPPGLSPVPIPNLPPSMLSAPFQPMLMQNAPPLPVFPGSIPPNAGPVPMVMPGPEPAVAPQLPISATIIRHIFKRAAPGDNETAEATSVSPPKESDNEVDASLVELAVAHQENWFTYLRSFNGSTLECHEWDFCRTARANDQFKTPLAKTGGKFLSYVTARIRDERGQVGERLIQAVDCCLAEDRGMADSCENYFHQKCLETDAEYALARS